MTCWPSRVGSMRTWNSWAGVPDPRKRTAALLGALARDERDPRHWSELATVRTQLRGRFHEVQTVVAALAKGTVRASSLVENLNSRLRNYFFLRRHLGSDYLALLQFFLNHRRLERSDRPERVGKTPTELLTGQKHPHWLELLGYTRFRATEILAPGRPRENLARQGMGMVRSVTSKRPVLNQADNLARCGVYSRTTLSSSWGTR